MKKKILKLSVITVILFVAICRYSYAAEQGVITGNTVKLREEASLNADLIMLLSVNDKVEVLGKEGDWYKVKYNSKTGYVFKDYIKVEEANKSNNTATNNSTANSTTEENTLTNKVTNTIGNDTNNSVTENKVNQNNTAQENSDTNTVSNNTAQTSINSNEITIPSEKIIKEDSEIRILPLINSSSISKVLKATKATVLEVKNGWVYVLTSNTSGWIRKEKLQDPSVEVPEPVAPEENKPEEPTEEQEVNKEPEPTKKVAYVNVNSVRVREEATTDSKIVDNLSKNDEVTVIGEKDEWSKVKVNNKEGYILTKYLSDKESTTTNRGVDVERTINKEVKEEEIKPTTTNTSNTTRSSIVEYAKTFLGYKYVSGGSTPTSGFDCSGFTCYVYKNFGYSLNRASGAQAKNGIEVSKEELQLGDLVLFSQGSKNIGHVGIYIGDNNFIHAANAKKGVVITSLSNSYYKANYVTARRIVN